MTARHATPLLAVEVNCSPAACEVILRDRSGLVAEELIVDLRKSGTGPGRAVLRLEHWLGMELSSIEFRPDATQLRVLGSALLAAADQAEART